MKNKVLGYSLRFFIIFIISFLSIQSSFVFQNPDVDVYNSFIRTGKNEFDQYAVSLVDDVGFFERNDRHFYRESEPMMFRSGKAFLNGSNYTLLESWQLNFENQAPIADQMYQRIHTWFGTATNFDDGHNIGMSTELYKKMFPEKEFNEFSSITLPFELNGLVVETNIAFLYSASLFEKNTNRGKLYKNMFGIDCLFVNKTIINEMGFNTLNIVYNQSNYSKLFNYKLFRSFSSNQISLFDCFSETNEVIISNLKLCQNLKILRIVCLVIDILLIAILVFKQTKKKEAYIQNYLFGISYSCFIVLFVLIERIINQTIVISSTGFWFVFLVGLFLLIYLTLMNKNKEVEIVWQERIYEISI